MTLNNSIQKHYDLKSKEVNISFHLKLSASFQLDSTKFI